MAFDSTRIVDQLNLKGSLPEGRFTDQELLDLTYDSLLSEVVPIVLLAREDYYVTYIDYPVTAGQDTYDLPSRALNGVLREVKLIRGTQIVDLTRRDLESIRTTQSGTPNSFYTSGDSLVLYPSPSVTQDTLRVYYFIRPSKLVPVSSCGRITAISGNDCTITIPSGWTTANTFDLVKGTGSFKIISIDLSATSVASGIVTFSSTLPTSLQIGDYITLSGETCFPMLPPEGHIALIQSAVTTALESIGDATAQTSAAKTEKLLSNFKSILGTRIQGAPKALGRRLL